MLRQQSQGGRAATTPHAWCVEEENVRSDENLEYESQCGYYAVIDL